MTREIEFRGKRLDSEDWVYGNPVEWLNESKDVSICCHPFGACIDSEGNLMMIEAPFVVKVDPPTVGQYTGQDDDRGNKIFQDDIVYGAEYESDEFGGNRMLQFYGIVEWDKNYGKWIVRDYPSNETYDLYDYSLAQRVVGNIHQNMDILEVLHG